MSNNSQHRFDDRQQCHFTKADAKTPCDRAATATVEYTMTGYTFRSCETHAHAVLKTPKPAKVRYDR